MVSSQLLWIFWSSHHMFMWERHTVRGHFTLQDIQCVSLLTINIHDADAHYARDNDQRETGSIVVHQQQPIDSCLHTEKTEWVKTTSPREKTKRSKTWSACVWDLPVSLEARPVRIQWWPLTVWPRSCSWWSSLFRSHRRWPSPESPADRTTRTQLNGRLDWTAVAHPYMMRTGGPQSYRNLNRWWETVLTPTAEWWVEANSIL